MVASGLRFKTAMENSPVKTARPPNQQCKANEGVVGVQPTASAPLRPTRVQKTERMTTLALSDLESIPTSPPPPPPPPPPPRGCGPRGQRGSGERGSAQGPRVQPATCVTHSVSSAGAHPPARQ
ncbi:unnamed protein product [Gadus morhua 'NCC']